MSYSEELRQFKTAVYKPLNYTKFAAFDLSEKNITMEDEYFILTSLQKINNIWYVLYRSNHTDMVNTEFKDLFEELDIELQCQIMDSIKTV